MALKLSPSVHFIWYQLGLQCICSSVSLQGIICLFLSLAALEFFDFQCYNEESLNQSHFLSFDYLTLHFTSITRLFVLIQLDNSKEPKIFLTFPDNCRKPLPGLKLILYDNASSNKHKVRGVDWKDFVNHKHGKQQYFFNRRSTLKS